MPRRRLQVSAPLRRLCAGTPLCARRGSYIAEAAVVLPFVILSVITIILIVLFFYESSVTECRMHMAMRCEAGHLTEKYTCYADNGTVLSSDDLWDGSITTSGASPVKRVSGSQRISMVHGGLLSHLGRRHLSGELRAVDPVVLLRLRQIVQSPDDGHGDDGGVT